MSEMMKLAEIVEKANGPDRELDARIWCVLNGKRYKSHWQAYQSEETQVEYTEPGKRKLFTSNGGNHAKQWTGSLDAAMTLVPATCLFWCRELWDDQRKAGYAGINIYRDMTHVGETTAVAATPAQALCAAALKARAHLEGE